MGKKKIDRIIKSLSEELDNTPLPEESLHAEILGDAIDKLKEAKFLLKLYKDR
jgi:hypothetical protein